MANLETHEAPAWLDRQAYPFELRRLRHSDGALAFVDEGPRDAPPLVFVHGNPSWSFMYRAQIADLRDRYRCIAVDHLGFGLSDKPRGASYHPADHARRLGAVLDALDLGEVHLVLHDWGGPIGMGWALDHPERVRSLLILNTWMWSLGKDPQARRFSRMLSSWPAQVAIRRFDVFVRYLMPKTFPDRRQFKAVKDQYTGPFQNAADRAGVSVNPTPRPPNTFPTESRKPPCAIESPRQWPRPTYSRPSMPRSGVLTGYANACRKKSSAAPS